MRLNPKRPPGRPNRKALLYVQEMHRLRAEGHSLNAIREALLDVGVTVSLSTVQREMARSANKSRLDRMRQAIPASAASHSTTAVPDVTSSPGTPDENSSDQPGGPVNGELSLARSDGTADRGTFSLLSKVLEAMRRLVWARRVA
jgi:hypothetical protein